jgi:hypothetical protein
MSDIPGFTMPRQLIREGLLGWWSVNEGSGTAIADNSEYDNNGTSSGTPTWGSGSFGSYLMFDGSNDVIIGNSPTNLITNVTIMAFIYLPDTARCGIFLKIGRDRGPEGDGSTGYSIAVGNTSLTTNGNHLIAQFEDIRLINTNTNIGTGWHHIAMRLDNSSVPSFTIDGVLVSGSYSGTAPTCPNLGQAGKIRIGGSYPTGYARFFNGGVRDVRGYSSVMPINQLSAIARGQG